MIALETLDYMTFAGLLEQPFALVGTDPPICLRLTQVSLLGGRRTQALRDPFALIFEGKADLRLPQGIYTLVHDTLGTMEIFLTELGLKEGHTRFEAVFT
jgi:hypothetical protein